MKKDETISLSLALGFVVSITVALLLDYGGWRKALLILAVILLLSSMGPFKAEGQKLNRVEKFMVIAFFSAFAVMIAFTFLYLGKSSGSWTPCLLMTSLFTLVFA